jgi:hypothetical protein
MSRLYLTAFLIFLCAVATTSTQLTGQHHPPPPTKHCTVQKNRNDADDSANILKAFTDCATNSIITFLPTNYSAFTPITLAGLSAFNSFPADAVEVDHRTMLDNVVIHLNGNLVLPNNITKVQQEINVTRNQPSVTSKFAFISGLLSLDVCIDIRHALVLLSWCGVCFLSHRKWY